MVHNPERQLPRASSFLHTNPTRLSERKTVHSPQTASVKPGGLQKQVPEEKGTIKGAEGFDAFRKNYEGFRANQKNITTLLTDITQSKTGQSTGESTEQYQTRVELSLVLSGMAKLDDSGHLMSRRQANRPMSARQFDQFNQAMNKPFSELIVSAHKSPQVDNSQLLNNPQVCTALGETAGLTPIKTSDDFYDRQQLLRDFFVIGEGGKTLTASGSGESSNLEARLPRFSDQKKLDDFQITQIDRSRRAGLKEDATETSIKPPGIDFETEKKTELPYDAQNKDMRFLALLNEFSYAGTGYCDAQSVARMTNDDEQGAAKYIEQRGWLNGCLHHASHSVMKHAFPEQMKNDYYQQVVLKREGADNAQWNSDMTQPRGGWLDSKPIESKKI